MGQLIYYFEPPRKLFENETGFLQLSKVFENYLRQFSFRKIIHFTRIICCRNLRSTFCYLHGLPHKVFDCTLASKIGRNAPQLAIETNRANAQKTGLFSPIKANIKNALSVPKSVSPTQFFLIAFLKTIYSRQKVGPFTWVFFAISKLFYKVNFKACQVSFRSKT